MLQTLLFQNRCDQIDQSLQISHKLQALYNILELTKTYNNQELNQGLAVKQFWVM